MDTTVPAPAPAASVPKETDEDVAKRLSHELNVTGRARKAPAPSYVPAPIKPGLDPERLKQLRRRQRDKERAVKDAAKAKAKARRAAAEAKRKKRNADTKKQIRVKPRDASDRPPKRPKKAKPTSHDELLCTDPLLNVEPLNEEPENYADDDVDDNADRENIDPDTPQPQLPRLASPEEAPDESQPGESPPGPGESPPVVVDYGVLGDDEDWQSKLPRREMPPPEGYSAGTLVWAFLR